MKISWGSKMKADINFIETENSLSDEIEFLYLDFERTTIFLMIVGMVGFIIAIL